MKQPLAVSTLEESPRSNVDVHARQSTAAAMVKAGLLAYVIQEPDYLVSRVLPLTVFPNDLSRRNEPASKIELYVTHPKISKV